MCSVTAANTVHPQLQKIKFQFSGLDKENTIMLEEITLKEANLKFMEQRNRIMKEIISEKKMKLQKERDVLDNLQNSVFQEKRQLCSRVREFSNKYGLLVTMKKHSDLALQHKRWLNTSEGTCIHAAEDDSQLESVLAAIEAELCDVDSKLEVSRLHLTSLQEERLHLLHTPSNEQKLHEIQDLKNQTELLEVQCEAVQQELGWQYLILKQAANV